VAIPQTPLIDQAAQQDQQSQQPGQLGGLRDMVQSPDDDLAVTLLEMADKMGILDEIFSPDGGEQPFEEDPRQDLSREDITLMVTKLRATSPEMQQKVMQALEAEAPPEVFQKIQAGMRLVR
jgi:hypothetical protein